MISDGDVMFLTHNENITSNIINCGYWEHQQPTIHGYIYIYTQYGWSEAIALGIPKCLLIHS